MPPDIVHSVCPHDCPSTCALEVERLDARTIGRVRGARDNSYTAGVICAKVARYAERVHHPDRLGHPLRRTGAKGSGRFERISWDEALDEVAGALAAAAGRYGPETVWPYFYAGTMGLVQRDGIERLRHVMRYSRQHSTICTTLVDAGWPSDTTKSHLEDLFNASARDRSFTPDQRRLVASQAQRLAGRTRVFLTSARIDQDALIAQFNDTGVYDFDVKRWTRALLRN